MHACMFVPHPRFLVQAHILSTGGDALMADALMALLRKGVWVFFNSSLFSNGRL